jgi:hypothetical protein
VNSSGAFRLSIAVALLTTIGWKVAIPADARGNLQNDLVSFFERNHFDVVVSDEVVNNMPIIRATTAFCELHVARLTPDGSNRNLIRHVSGGTDRSFIVFRGSVYAQQPVFWTVVDYLWSRGLRELGLVVGLSPVISVGENRSCNAERLPWGELQSAPSGDYEGYSRS